MGLALFVAGLICRSLYSICQWPNLWVALFVGGFIYGWPNLRLTICAERPRLLVALFVGGFICGWPNLALTIFASGIVYGGHYLWEALFLGGLICG